MTDRNRFFTSGINLVAGGPEGNNRLTMTPNWGGMQVKQDGGERRFYISPPVATKVDDERVNLVEGYLRFQINEIAVIREIAVVTVQGPDQSQRNVHRLLMGNTTNLSLTAGNFSITIPASDQLNGAVCIAALVDFTNDNGEVFFIDAGLRFDS